MLQSFTTLFPLAADQVVRPFTTNPALSPWILVPAVILVTVLIYYLYSAQRQIASGRIVGWLTGIRIALILLLGVLLLRPMWVRHHTEKSSETLWVVLDQSLSMAQKDGKATPLERLHWADALGLLPAETRVSKLDRSAARLYALHDDLLHLQGQKYGGVDQAETTRLAQELVQSLKVWNENLADVTSRLEKDPKVQSGDAASITKDLHAIHDEFATDLGKAAQQAGPAEVSTEMHWAKTGAAADAVLAKLKLLADQVDNEFLTSHASDPAVKDALLKVSQMRRADIAYGALTGKSHDLPKSLADVFERQNTKVITFAGGQQIIATASKKEIPKAVKGGVEPIGNSTNIADALKFVSEQISQGERASVLVVSDGRINDGGDPMEAAQRLAARGVRLFTLALGSNEVSPDAAVEFVDAPDWVFKDDTLKASALVRLDGLAGQPVKIEFLRGSTIIDTQTITPTSGQESRVVNFKDKPPEPNVYEYMVRAQQMPDEVVKENNIQTFRVSVKNDKLKVLIVEDQPRWEDRYLANYLKRDNRVQLQQVLLEAAHVAGVTPPPKIKASPNNPADLAQILPGKPEEWAAYDLIVLGDIPTEFLSPETQNNIATAVSKFGATLLVIAGPLNMPARYTGSPLAELLPVHLSSNWSVASLADHLKHGFLPKVSGEGAQSVMGQLALDEKTNGQYWSMMPNWYWHSEQTQAKQSATVLWEIADSKAESEPTPETATLAEARKRALLSTVPVGLGRVMYLASDSTWRMRQVNGVNLHERLWGQVIRWVVQSDMPAGGKFVRFGTSKPRYLAGDAIVVTVRLMNEDFTPKTGQKFKVVAHQVTQKDPQNGQVQAGAEISSADVVEAPEAPGVYRATLSNIGPGGVQIALRGPEVEKALNDDTTATQKVLLVDMLSGTDREMKNVNADHHTLSRLAEAGNGMAADIAYADVLAQHIPNLETPQETIQQIGLFADPENPYTKKAHWGFLILFVSLITAEWVLRKVGGLV